MKSALITGITGQDGSYLAEFLLEKGYEVHGLVRRSSSHNGSRISHLLNQNHFCLHEGDLTDSSSLKRVVETTLPDEVYNLAAMSDVKISFDLPEYTADVDAVGVVRLLEVLRSVSPHSRFYQASSSELYGKVMEAPQDEKTPFRPRSPYAISKLYAYWSVVSYREAYRLFACNGILFNHESPRRGKNFVSRKITMAAAAIKLGIQEKLVLGNLSARRDWGYAKDYVEGMWLMLQQEEPDDYVLATGVSSTVREFVEIAFNALDMPIEWQGKGLQERGIDARTGKERVTVSPAFFRPAEVDVSVGNPKKAARKLGWIAQTALRELVLLMVENDYKAMVNHADSSRT